MSDYAVVYFKCFERGFHIPSVLAEFSIFGIPVSIKWYGAIIAFGFLLAVLFGGRGAYKWKMSLDKMIDVLIYGTILGVIGARLYYVLAEWSYYKDHLSSIVNIREGGLGIYGGLIGGIIAAYIVCKVEKLNFLNLLDLCAMSFLIGQGIGRWGNFTNQEVFGVNTSLPWGMWSEKTAAYINAHQAEFIKNGLSIKAGTILDKVYVHPIFLYESLWCLLGFGVLYLICRKYRKFSGQLILCYGIWYGIGRGIVEGLRTDSIYLVSGGLTLSQVRSFSMAIICAVVLIVLLRKYKKNPKPIEGIDYFPVEEKKVKVNKKAKTGEPELAAEADYDVIEKNEETVIENNPDNKESET